MKPVTRKQSHVSAVPLLAFSPGPPQTKDFSVEMLITPEQSKLWLKGNVNNRSLSEDVVMKYASDMAEGRWKFNYDSILISKDGLVFDGQHRLEACVLSGLSFRAVVVFNATEEMRDTKDIGKVRTAGDMGQLKNLLNSKRCCAAAHLVLLDRNGGGIQRMNNPKVKPSKTLVVSEALANAEIQEALVFSAKKSLCAPRVMDFCNYKFRQVDPVAAAKFMDAVVGGQNLKHGDPAYTLREKLHEQSPSRQKFRELVLVAFFYKAFNYFRAGKKLTLLRWNEGEEFPTI